MTTRPRELGEPFDVVLPTARLQAFTAGPADGPVVVLVHGLLVNADLWRDVVPPLAAAGLRCITVDWPLGAHHRAVPDADLTPPGVADLVGDVLDALDLRDVTVLANDTGGGLTQVLMTRRSERIGRVVLTPSDSFERFFPPTFAALPWLARVPGAVWLLSQALRVRAVQRLPIAFGWVTRTAVTREEADAYLGPSRRDRGVRRDLARFLRGVHRRHTLAAAEALPAFDRPVLLAWATQDRLFPVSLAHRLAERLPDARIVMIDDSYTFVPRDQPAALVRHVLQFVAVDEPA